MTKKEINEYYEELDHNCINNYGGYSKKEIDDLYNRLPDEEDDDYEDYDDIWGDISCPQDWEDD